MNLAAALKILKQPVAEDAHTLRVFLACGFTPLHLSTFLAAHLRRGLPHQSVEVKTGLFGDLARNIERITGSACDVLVVVMEWQDLDPRLGIRTLGGWRATDIPDIVRSANQAAVRLENILIKASASVPIRICMPSLPLPPLFTTVPHQADQYELELRQLVDSFAVSICRESSIRILSPQSLDEYSPMKERFDVQSELVAGFPYTLAHASAIAELLAVLIQTPTPKKGLITDLDDTLWAGILGEVGAEGISWHLDQHTPIHGLYQQFLGSLASAGVLIAVASKNDRVLVEQAFEREDLIVSMENVFPIEANWNRKSESVKRILDIWNVGADSVVFVDDSPMEIADVNAAFPEMECIVFPKNDYQATWDLLKRMRELFGKNVVSAEDSIRLQSIRSAEAVRESARLGPGSLDDFLHGAEATIQFAFGRQAGDRRAFDLINKTNQFNLNGKRLSDAEWMSFLNDPSNFLMTVSYKDKYGPLGKVAAILGSVQANALRVNSWVMSCRAFSRRIEYQLLKQLFDKFTVEEICFDYHPTSRNTPLQEFFTGLLDTPLNGDLRLSRATLWEKSPSLSHRVEEVVNG